MTILPRPTAPVNPDELRAAGLGGYAYATLPAEHPLRAAMKPDYLAALGRHQSIREELAPLVTAWNRAGIEPLIFKGFHLAEWVYPAPGMRFHGDVDMLVRTDEAEPAVAIAGEAGWSAEMNTLETGRRYSHGVANLLRPGGATQIDLHRKVLHARSAHRGPQAHITAAVLDRSVRLDWGGCAVRVPTPEDAVIILALQRAWGERWRLKPADPLDVQALASAMAEGWRGRVLQRARILGCERTAGLFLERCAPVTGPVSFAPANRRDRWRLELATRGEAPPRRWRTWWLARGRLLATRWTYVFRALPQLLRTRWALRRTHGIPELLESMTPADPPERPRTSRAVRARTVLGIRWAQRLLPEGPSGRCLVRSLTIYRALRAQGWAVQFVSGVRSTEEGVTGHAWVTLDGRTLPELAEPHNDHVYEVNVRFPPTDSAGGSIS